MKAACVPFRIVVALHIVYYFVVAVVVVVVVYWCRWRDGRNTPLQPKKSVGLEVKAGGILGLWACFRAENVVNNSLALRADLEEDVVLMTSLILSKTQRIQRVKRWQGKSATKAGQKGNGKCRKESAKKFALNCQRVPKTQNRNASLAAIQAEVAPPPQICFLPFPLGSRIDETATIAVFLCLAVIKINSKPKPVNQRESKAFGELYTWSTRAAENVFQINYNHAGLMLDLLSDKFVDVQSMQLQIQSLKIDIHNLAHTLRN